MKKKCFIAIVTIAMLTCCVVISSSVYTDYMKAGQELEYKEQITMEFLQEQTSWDTLVRNTKNLELNPEEESSDYGCQSLIAILETFQNDNYYEIPEAFHFQYRIAIAGGGFESGDFLDKNEKYSKIVELYNESNPEKVYLTYQFPCTDTFEYSILTDTYWVDKLKPRNMGEHVILREGASYWESSNNDGSGISNTITGSNVNISVFAINGVAYLNDARESVISSSYSPYGEILEEELDYGKPLMLHLCTDTTDLGWVHADDVISVNELKRHTDSTNWYTDSLFLFLNDFF